MQFIDRKGENRFKMTLHWIADKLVLESRSHNCSVIVFGDLTNIGERIGASWEHKLAFNRLSESESEFAEYESAEHDTG